MGKVISSHEEDKYLGIFRVSLYLSYVFSLSLLGMIWSVTPGAVESRTDIRRIVNKYQMVGSSSCSSWAVKLVALKHFYKLKVKGNQFWHN